MLEELQKLLKESSVSREQIVKDTGVSDSTIRGIITGRKPNPTINTYATLIQYLKADAAKGSRRKAAIGPAPTERAA